MVSYAGFRKKRSLDNAAEDRLSLRLQLGKPGIKATQEFTAYLECNDLPDIIPPVLHRLTRSQMAFKRASRCGTKVNMLNSQPNVVDRDV